MKTRLSILYFLQFGVWGCYLGCFGQFLGAAGLGMDIAWFYAAIGIVSLFTPAFMGHLADRKVKPAVLLALCHGLAAITMFCAWLYAGSHPVLEFKIFYPLYLLFLALYMPTMALSNTTAFGIMKSRGIMPVDAFPAIRVWGTVGFVIAMWFVNCAYWHDGVFGFTLTDSHPFSHFRFQYTSMQLLCAAVVGVLTSLYAFTLPKPENAAGMAGRGSIYRGNVIRQFFSVPSIRIFLIFAAFSGVCLQISNGFATPFITHFMGLKEYAGSLASGNATMLFSLSQISEAVCILLVGVALKRYGIRIVFSLGLIAWSLRYLLFAFGNPGDGLWMLVLSMIAYGIAFNFLTIAGHLYMEQASTGETKGFGQGVMMLMSNGVGATIGTAVAGSVINHWCSWEMVPSPAGNGMIRLFMGDWMFPWLIFALYSLVIAVMFFLFFRTPSKGRS